MTYFILSMSLMPITRGMGMGESFILGDVPVMGKQGQEVFLAKRQGTESPLYCLLMDFKLILPDSGQGSWPILVG